MQGQKYYVLPQPQYASSATITPLLTAASCKRSYDGYRKPRNCVLLLVAMALLLYAYSTLTTIIAVSVYAIEASIACGSRDATAARRVACTAATGTDTALTVTDL